MKKVKKQKKIRFEFTKLFIHLPIIIIVLLAFIVRLYKVNSPLSDHHSWRQADTSAVTRNFIKNGIDLLHPKYDDLSPIQSGIDNPNGYRMVEFPLYNVLSAKLYSLSLNTINIETSGRMISILFSLIMIFSLYVFMRNQYSLIAGLASAFFISFFPFSVFYSRTILPDTTAISMAVFSIVLFYFGHLKHNFISKLVLIFLSLLIFAVSLLIKPTVIFYGLVFIAILVKIYGLDIFKKPILYMLPLTLIPFLLWRWWIMKYPEGIPASQWLLTSVNTMNGLEKIFFKPAFFRWIFIERIQNMILGGLSIFFVILGILNVKQRIVTAAIGFAGLIYLFTFQGGNVQHDYYQIIILPAIAIFFGIGINTLFDRKYSLIKLTLHGIVLLFLIVLSLFYSWYNIRFFFDTNDTLHTIAQIIKTVTPSNSRIVTDTTGDTTLLYLSDRKGYPAPVVPWTELKNRGMEYFVTMKKEVGEDLKNTLPIVFESDTVYIFKL